MEKSREVFIKDIDRDEMRSGFLVTSHRKKLWNVQIGLINEFARICKKHNLRWFAICGTLLGAARHKGFIPWDDDVDIVMFRPDYEKFQAIAANEIKDPYFADIWYNYRLESEGASLNDPEGDFQFITLEQEKACDARDWFTQFPSIRLRDSRTTMLEFPSRNFINQGIWIDIFPLDTVPPFVEEKHSILFDVEIMLLLAAATPLELKEWLRNNLQFFSSHNNFERIISRTYRERGKIFDSFMSENFFMSERVGHMFEWGLVAVQKSYNSKDFNEIIYLPFENIEVPAPAGYDQVLTDYYGDWHEFVIQTAHVVEWSADVSFEEYRKKSFHFNQRR